MTRTVCLLVACLGLLLPLAVARDGPCGDVEGQRHRNPDNSAGGFVAKTAQVAKDAHVDPWAAVCGNARVESGARIEDRAVVTGDAVIEAGARVSDLAEVGENARVTGKAHVTGRARVSGNAVVSDTALVFGLARIDGDAAISGSAQVGGTAKHSTGGVASGLDLGTAEKDLSEAIAGLEKAMKKKDDVESVTAVAKPYRIVLEYSGLEVEGGVVSYDYSQEMRQFESAVAMKHKKFYRKTTEECRVSFSLFEVAEVRIDDEDDEQPMVWVRMQEDARARFTQRKQSEVHLPTTRRKSTPKDATETDVFITFMADERSTLVKKFADHLSRAVAIAQGMRVPE